jgi:tetratricopeptide (TPR) repeat protein
MTEKRISLRETMRRALPSRAFPFLMAVLLLAGLALVCPGFVQPAAAQASALENGPAPPPDDPAAPPSATPAPSAPSAPSSSPSPSASGAPADKPATPGEAPAVPADTAPEQPAWDPLHANKDVEVGIFYMKKGEWDAAIDRFQEAGKLQPGLAKPYELLGESYEKKGQNADAAAAYRKYLKLYSDAPDRDKIRKRIEKLDSHTPHDASNRS